MSITLTANYRETLAPETLTAIDAFTEDNYDLGAILEFIDEHSESDFVQYYEEYVELGESYCYEAVDAYLTLYDVDELSEFASKYIGEFSSAARMAEEYFEYEADSLDHRISIDWDETGKYLIDHDVDCVGDYYFRCY